MLIIMIKKMDGPNPWYIFLKQNKSKFKFWVNDSGDPHVKEDQDMDEWEEDIDMLLAAGYKIMTTDNMMEMDVLLAPESRKELRRYYVGQRFLVTLDDEWKRHVLQDRLSSSYNYTDDDMIPIYADDDEHLDGPYETPAETSGGELLDKDLYGLDEWNDDEHDILEESR